MAVINNISTSWSQLWAKLSSFRAQQLFFCAKVKQMRSTDDARKKIQIYGSFGTTENRKSKHVRCPTTTLESFVLKYAKILCTNEQRETNFITGLHPPNLGPTEQHKVARVGGSELIVAGHGGKKSAKLMNFLLCFFACGSQIESTFRAIKASHASPLECTLGTFMLFLLLLKWKRMVALDSLSGGCFDVLLAC